mgnify:CR=1 FL=1
MEIILKIDGKEVIKTDKIVISNTGKLLAYKDDKLLNLNFLDTENSQLCIELKDIK